MGDDIAQLCQVETEIGKIVVKGSMEIALWVGRMINALCQKGKEGAEILDEKLLNAPGEKKTLAEIAKLAVANGSTPQGIDIREEDFGEIIKLAKDKGLHFWRAVDPDPSDKMTPIQVPGHEMAAWGQIMHIVGERRLLDDKEGLDIVNKEISEIKEKMRNAEPGSEEMKSLEVRLENMTQAREEAQKWVDYSEKFQATPDDKIGYEITDYLREFKDTDFEEHPEIAIAELEKRGVEIGKKISAKECLQPIRDKSFMPQTKLTFYVPEVGAVVTREFHLDEKTNLVYSDYSFKTPNGEIKTFSDHNMTKADWNNTVLPELFQKAGVLEGTMCRAFDTEDKLKSYMKYHGTVENPAKAMVQQKLKEGKPVFSSAEAKNMILNAMSEADKGFASAKVDENIVEFLVTPDMFTNRGGKMDFKLSEDEHIQFSTAGVTPDLAGNGMFKMRIDAKSNPVFVKTVGEAVTTIPITPLQAKERMDIALGRSENLASQTLSHGALKPKGR